MKTKGALWLRLLGVRLFFVVLGCLALLFLATPPLIPSGAYKVSYFVNGSEYHDAKIYRTLNFNGKTYVFLPQASGIYGWVGVDWHSHKVFLPALFPEPLLGCNCIHYDVPDLGINNPKLEGGWEIVFRPGGVDLSNKQMTWPPKPQQLSIRISSS